MRLTTRRWPARAQTKAAAQVLAAAGGLAAQSEALRRHFDTFVEQMRAA